MFCLFSHLPPLSFKEEMEMVLLKIQHAGSNTFAQVHSGKEYVRKSIFF